MLDKAERKRLSKTLAHALRHEPDRYGIMVDDHGWANVDDLLAALREKRRLWRNLTRHDLDVLIEESDKKRYERRGDRIRAYYGHTLPVRIEKPPAEPPELLYHGTGADVVPAILNEGLKPMRRQYVHLSTDHHTAYEVGSRHSDAVKILTVLAKEAHEAGVHFYHGNEQIWLADPIPPEFLVV